MNTHLYATNTLYLFLHHPEEKTPTEKQTNNSWVHRSFLYPPPPPPSKIIIKK